MARACVRVSARAYMCVRACVRSCVGACVSACVSVCVCVKVCFIDFAPMHVFDGLCSACFVWHTFFSYYRKSQFAFFFYYFRYETSDSEGKHTA